MAKKITGYIKLQISGGKANPAPIESIRCLLVFQLGAMIVISILSVQEYVALSVKIGEYGSL